MAFRSPLIGAINYNDQHLAEFRGVLMAAAHSSSAEAAYQTAAASSALIDRSDRGLVVVTGKDRKTWLHNLVTNEVKKLEAGGGCYAFALDVKGRIQFDLNILDRGDSLWLDIDRSTIAAALKHLDLRLITEDVKLADASDRFARLGVCGPDAARIARELPVPDGEPPIDLRALAHCATRVLAGGGVLVRTDFAGGADFEIITTIEDARRLWPDISETRGACPIGFPTLDVLRIEAGIPWLGRDLDDKVLPPETGLVARGISYHKGCYLGQEVIERMRSHNVLARRLVRLEITDASAIALPAALTNNGSDVGRVTSLVEHPVRHVGVGLGYLKSSIREFDGLTLGDPPRSVKIVGEGLRQSGGE